MSLSAAFLVSVLVIVDAKNKPSNLNSILNKNDCLRTNSFRIIGAENAEIGDFPYQVSLQDRSRKHFCGGSIINKRWILTAAHCLHDLQNDDILIVTGTNQLDTGGITYKSTKLIIHQNFSLVNELHDIGLLMVNETIQFNNFTKPIDLPKNDTDEHWTRHPAVVSGWGYTSRGGPLSNNLKYLVTCLPNQKVCTSKIAVVNAFQKVCTINKSHQGICQGDSGGPLVVNGLQIGLVSYHIVLCAFGFPDFYTRVSYYSDWINEQIQSVKETEY